MRSLVLRLVVPLVLGAAVALAAPLTTLLAQSAANPEEMLIGVWRLDLSRSRYYPGPPPTSETRTYALDEEGVHGTIRRVYADGREEIIKYRSGYDRDYPVSGTQAYDALLLRKIDDWTAEAVLSHAGRIFGTARRTLSTDGQTMTIAFKREVAQGGVSNEAFYRKEK